MPPFDRAHMTSYSTLIVTMCPSFTDFEIQPVICRKSPILTHPTCIWHPCERRPRSNFVEIFRNRKLESLGYRVVVCVILRLAVLVELQLVTDTDRHRPMASTADA